MRWDKTDFRNWKYRLIVTTKKNFSPLRVVNQASPEPYFFAKWKFAILVLEAWDYHQMNSHEVGTWIYVPHLISAMFGFCTNLQWNLHKLGSDTVYLCKFLCRLVQKPITLCLDLCATLDICYIWFLHKPAQKFVQIYSVRTKFVQILMQNCAKTKHSRYQVWHINPGSNLMRIHLVMVPGL